MSHHQEDTKVEPFSKTDMGFRELVYLWVFGLTAAGAVMFSFLYFNSLEDFAAPPFMVALLVGIGVAFALSAGNMVFRWFFSFFVR